MALDLDSIPGPTREALIEGGRKFGLDDTLAQANSTLKAYEEHGAKIAEFGFDMEDKEELRDAVDELIAAGVGREQKRTGKKETNRSYLAAVKGGQAVRLRARAVLVGARRKLARRAGNEEALRLIDSVLEHGSVAEDEANRLTAQLDQLRRVVDDGAVAPAAVNRGGPKAVADLAAQAGILRAQAQAASGGRGTPEATQKLDLIDGIILELVREARAAGDAAAKELGDPAIAKAFALTELYGEGGQRAGGEPTDDAGGGTGEATGSEGAGQTGAKPA